ncbi:MAG: hypothetical protein H6741_07345 [Alphaproteobacteria bacterium]|nr:hypothetical protein [Alphaproteobacteria bacterium]
MWFALLLACTDAPDSAPSDSSPSDSPTPLGVERSAVSWRLAVDLDGVEITEDGALALGAAGGAEVELEQAWVTVYVLVLEPCDPVARAPWSWLPTAYAHGLPDHASTLSQSVAVDLTEASARDLETLSFEAGRFCDVGLALLRADGTTAGLPEEGWLDDLSLSLEGRWRPPDGEWQALSLRSALPAERDLPLDSEADPITLTLSPRDMLAAAELDGDLSRAGLSALTGLAEGATIQVGE